MVAVSVIIPVYKVEQYIEECLLSVINQVYNGVFECIIIDDCTPDESMYIVNRVLSSYHGKIQFKIISHQHNQGLSAARNTGAKIATGNYIYFLDSDDSLTEQTLESLLKLCRNEQPDVVMGNFKIIEECNHSLSNSKIKSDNYKKQSDIFNSFISYDLYEMAWNKLVKRSFFLQHELWFREGIIHEDNLWSFFLFFYCGRLKVCMQETYCYRIRKNSIMTDARNQIKSFLSNREIFHTELDFIKKYNLYYHFPLLTRFMLNQKICLQSKHSVNSVFFL